MDVSVYSFIVLIWVVCDLLILGFFVLSMIYFGGEKCVFGYNVMGICKLVLELVMWYFVYDMGLYDV